MHVSIDMDKLVFLHKHHDRETLSALAWLEAPDRSVMVEDTAREAFLCGMGRLDLCLLYKHTTGAELVHSESNVLRRQLAEMLDHTPATVAVLDEVRAQVAAVEDDLHAGRAHRYARGAKVPAAPQELFPLVAKPLSEAALAGAERRAPQGLTRAEAAPAPPPPPAPTAKVRAVGVRPVIWEAADAAWEAAGRPTDKAAVLAMRRTVMAELAEHKGIKATTSSNELGAWQKARLG